MWRYRYLREFIPDDELIGRCNALGDEGWSMVGAPRWVPPEEDWATGLWACFFKRTVSNREQIRALFELSPDRGAMGPGGALGPGGGRRGPA